jgi:hypothetical protein
MPNLRLPDRPGAWGRDRHLQHWKADPDLIGIRDGPRLAKHPEAERKDGHALWAEVEALLKKAIRAVP